MRSVERGVIPVTELGERAESVNVDYALQSGEG
jgi:hypothetical protein